MKTLIFIIYFLNPVTGDISVTSTELANLNETQCTDFVNSINETREIIEFTQAVPKEASYKAYCV